MTVYATCLISHRKSIEDLKCNHHLNPKAACSLQVHFQPEKQNLIVNDHISEIQRN